MTELNVFVVMKADQERVKTLLADTVTLLCKNGLFFSKQLKVQGLLGITVDDDEVFIVHIDELFKDGVASQSTLPSATNPNVVATESVDELIGPVLMENLSNENSSKSCSSNLANSPSLKRRLPEQLQSASVKSRDDGNSSLNEPPSKRYIVENCTEESGQHIEEPKQEKDDRMLDDKTNIIVVKEETEGEFALVDANPMPCDRKASSNSPEFLQQLFNQFEQTTNEEFAGFDIDAYALQSRMTSDCSPVISTSLHLSTKAEAASNMESDALSAWKSSYQPRCLSQGHMDIHNDTQVSSQFDNSDVYVLPNFCITSRRTTTTNTRRKRYECTLDSCGRQYQNTFDLYRHQRQKHNVPPEFFQQGRKHTFGIREIDPS